MWSAAFVLGGGYKVNIYRQVHHAHNALNNFQPAKSMLSSPVLDSWALGLESRLDALMSELGVVASDPTAEDLYYKADPLPRNTAPAAERRGRRSPPMARPAAASEVLTTRTRYASIGHALQQPSHRVAPHAARH